tara:strand:+ start:47 stop:421 length:375 start_codon:yes stop_codon:yes gene_type:complete
MRQNPTKKDLKFVEQMDNGETSIKYNESFTQADLVYKNDEGEPMGIPLEWSDRDCLKEISENIKNAIQSMKDDMSDAKVFSKNMTTIESLVDVIKLHMSKDDLFIIREPAKSNHEKYLKNIGAE